tara:strand:- start:226 stop:390 length:165 start_codon:yes stop_codon:yes gene_type:complete
MIIANDLQLNQKIYSQQMFIYKEDISGLASMRHNYWIKGVFLLSGFITNQDNTF